MGVKPIQLYKTIEEGKTAVGVRVTGKANLQDLLDIWQPLCDDTEIYKQYAPGNYSVCRGCKINCCSSAYVTPDLVALKKMGRFLKIKDSNLIENLMQKDKLNAGILQLKVPCTFLKEGICTIYPIRSLICRFYICTDISGPTQQLIYSITTTGIAATYVWAERERLLKHSSCQGQSSFDLALKRLLEEYRNHDQVKLFLQAEEYSDIPLEPFLSEDI